MKGNEGKREREKATEEPKAEPVPMVRGWVVAQARGGGYRMMEVLMPATTARAHMVSEHPPDMRQIVGAKIAHRIATVDFPPAWGVAGVAK